MGIDTTKKANTALVIDDEVEICILLSAQLRKIGFEAAHCLNFKTAKEQLSKKSYDLVLVDLNLPDGSGFDLIHELRTIDDKVKIIVISAYDADRKKVLDLGANIYLAKPFTRKAILGALRQLNLIMN